MRQERGTLKESGQSNGVCQEVPHAMKGSPRRLFAVPGVSCVKFMPEAYHRAAGQRFHHLVLPLPMNDGLEAATTPR